MKINAINVNYSALRTRNEALTKTNGVVTEEPIDAQNLVMLSFGKSSGKNPLQIALYATESNFLGGIYKAGGLGDVSEALPESMGLHAKEVLGQEVDARTFFPYYSLGNDKGQIYVVTKSGVEKFNKGETLNKAVDFKYVDANYVLQEGESFALVTEEAGDTSQNIKRMFLMKETGLAGNVECARLNGLEMETVPYKIFEVDTSLFDQKTKTMVNTRKDKMYMIYTPEQAQGKAAYGVFSKYAEINGTTAYGGSAAYGGSSAYGGSQAYGGSSAAKQGKFFAGRAAGDMFYTEQIRAMEKSLPEMNILSHGNFNPQNIGLHDRFGYVFMSDIVQDLGPNDYYKGIRFVPFFHNLGRTYQGVYSNPIDFYRIVATKEDFEKLKANPHYNRIKELDKKIAQGKATQDECTQVYNFFKPYFEKYIDSEGEFNMTKIAIATTKDFPGNCVPGNVSKNFGNETRSFATEDIAKGLTKSLQEIEQYTVDVVNGAKPANMATDSMTDFFGNGELKKIFNDPKNPRHYTPFSKKDSVDKIFQAKKKNKENLINIIADATEKAKTDSDALIKLFLGSGEIENNRKGCADLKLTLGGLSKYKEGDKLLLSWGRPDPQKGLKVTARAFRMFLEDESVPLEVRKNTKMLFGAGKDVFKDGHPEWEGIKAEMEKIANIEVQGEKAVFKGNALYVNSLFPNRLANCADASDFTSRFEPCGITPFESFATGTPSMSLKTGGAPDFIKPGKTGLLTEKPFMLSPKELGLPENVAPDVLDEARVERAAKDMAQTIKEYMSSVQDGTFDVKQKTYIQNCLKEKIEWHNNNNYNGGKSALELYLKQRFSTEGALTSEITAASRGEFDSSAIKKPKAKGKGGKAAIIIASVAVLGGLAYAGIKKGWFAPKQEEAKLDVDIDNDFELDEYSEIDDETNISLVA